MGVKKITFKNREEWEQYRNSGSYLGSSDVGTILGLNPYETPYQYWRRKKTVTDDPVGNKIHLVRGQATESATVEIFCYLTGEKAIKRSQGFEVYTNSDLASFVQVAPDVEFFARGTHDDRYFGEVKDTKFNITQDDLDYPAQSAYKVMQMWYAQGQFQCHVAEKLGFWLIIYNGQKDVVYKFYPYNPEVATHIYNESIIWWGKYMIGDDIPAMQTAEDAVIAHPSHKDGLFLKADEKVRDLVNKLKEAKKRLNLAKEEISELEAYLKIALGEGEAFIWEDKPLITWRAHEVGRLDTKRLKEEIPDVAAKYTNINVERKFLVK